MKWMFNSRNLLMMSGLVAFMAAPASADKMKATLAQSISPLAAIATVAKAKDFYGKHGLDIEVKYFTSGKRSLAAVMGGGADIATNAESPTTADAVDWYYDSKERHPRFVSRYAASLVSFDIVAFAS